MPLSGFFALVDLSKNEYFAGYLFGAVMFLIFRNVIGVPLPLTLCFWKLWKLLISHLDSLGRVIVSLQMLKFGKELRGKREGKGAGGKKQLLPQPVPPNYMKSSAPPCPQLLISPPFLHSAQFFFLPSYSHFYTYSPPPMCPKRQPGQAVFTAEVIGVVWRESDLCPAKAEDVCVRIHVCIRLFLMTGSEASEGK